MIANTECLTKSIPCALFLWGFTFCFLEELFSSGERTFFFPSCTSRGLNRGIGEGSSGGGTGGDKGLTSFPEKQKKP